MKPAVIAAIVGLICCFISSSAAGGYLLMNASPAPETETTPEKIRGCMDSTATNYNASAEEDDGSCISPPDPVVGCNISQANNFDPNVTEPDIGMCDFDRPKTLYLTGKCDDSNIRIQTQAYPADIPQDGFKTSVTINKADQHFPPTADEYNNSGIDSLPFWITQNDENTDCATAFENTVGVVGPKIGTSFNYLAILDPNQTIPAYNEDGNGYVIVPVKS